MKKTALYNEHFLLKGRMVDFADWQLPVMYSSIIKEHIATRTAVTIFDISHMGEISLKGKRVTDFLKRIIPTSLNKLKPGSSMYSCLCNEDGGVIDDLFIYMIEQDNYYLVVNSATLEKDLKWLKKQNSFGVYIQDLSSQTSKIDIQGPKSTSVMKKIFSEDKIAEITRFKFKHLNYRENPVMVSCTGYTGETGFELFIPNELAVDLWKDFLVAGKEEGILPAGLGARDSLRLEACYSLYGHELDETISPVEAGLGWLVTSEEDYIGKDVLEEQKHSGALRKIIAFELNKKGVPRDGYRIQKENVDIGYCTSGGFSPTYNKGIGLALVNKESCREGDIINIIIRGKEIAAKVVKRPFYSFNNK